MSESVVHKVNLVSNEVNQKTKNEFFNSCTESMDQIFSAYCESLNNFNKSIYETQKEIMKGWENFFKDSSGIQKQLSEKSGVNNSVPENVSGILENTIEEFIKVNKVRDQVILETVDMTKRNIQTFNEGIKTFSELNNDMLNLWLSTIESNKKDSEFKNL